MKINLLHNHIVKYIGTFVGSFMIGVLAGKLAMPISGAYAVNEIVVNEDNTATVSETTTEKNLIEEAAVSDIASADIYDASANKNTSYAISYTSSANAAIAPAQKDFYVPGIVNVNVSYTDCNTLPNPDKGPLQCQNLIYGHRATDFAYIPYIKAGDIITVRGKNYKVRSSASYVKTDNKHININGKDVEMSARKNNDNIGLYNYADMIIMTCDNGTANRWLVFADLV